MCDKIKPNNYIIGTVLSTRYRIMLRRQFASKLHTLLFQLLIELIHVVCIIPFETCFDKIKQDLRSRAKKEVLSTSSYILAISKFIVLLVVDVSVLPERPKLEVVQRFVEKGLGITSSDLRSIQLHNIRHCVLIEMADPAAAIKVATENHLKYAFKSHPGIKIPVYVDDNTVDVRVHDLPLDLPNAKIIEAMQQYGEVITIRDEVWRNFFAGVPNGVRVLKMKLTKPVPSYITVCELETLATHTNQITTCRRCGGKRHVSRSCSEAAKKSDAKKQQKRAAETNLPAPIVLPPAEPTVVESQAVLPSTVNNGNDGFTTVVKKGKTKRQLSDEEANKSAEKRSCVDDDNNIITIPNSGNDQGQPMEKQTDTLNKFPRRSLWKRAD